MNRCPICQGQMAVAQPSVTDALSNETFSINRCADCGLSVTHPMPMDMCAYYPPVYYGGRHGFSVKFCIRRRLRWLGQVRGKLLDIGCGDGSFLLAAQELGWQVEGVEREPDAAARRGLHVAKTLDRVVGINYDRMTFWHSLEHIPEGAEVLRQAAAKLSANGKILIAVPDYGGWQARFFGAKWLHADVPRHVYHFTRQALTRMCKNAGLRIGCTWHQEFEYDVLGWSQSLLNVLFREPNQFFSWLTGKPLRVKGIARALQVALGIVFSVACVPLVWISTACGRGGTLVVEAYVQE